MSIDVDWKNPAVSIGGRYFWLSRSKNTRYIFGFWLCLCTDVKKRLFFMQNKFNFPSNVRGLTMAQNIVLSFFSGKTIQISYWNSFNKKNVAIGESKFIILSKTISKFVWKVLIWLRGYFFKRRNIFRKQNLVSPKVCQRTGILEQNI